jgi:MFS family permease
LVASLVGGALLVAPMALVPRFEQVLALAVLLGLVAGGSLTLCYTIGGLMVPEAVRTTAFGFFSAAALFGGALAPSVAGLVAHLSLLGIYFVDAALYLLLAVALVRRGALGGKVSA